MKRRFSEEQIIPLLKQHEVGVPVAQICREHNVSQATFYKWKAKYGGMDVSKAKRLRQLEEENAKLKRLLTDAMLDNAALKDLLGKPGEARPEEAGCAAPPERAQLLPAAGVWTDAVQPRNSTTLLQASR
jgi:putative transposase